MRPFAIARHLPGFLANPLFGDREKYGLNIQPDDPSWQEWLTKCHEFYEQTQKQSVGKTVNDAGYQAMRWVDLDGLRILEIGPGQISHIQWWIGKPRQFVMVDVEQRMLELSARILKQANVPYEAYQVSRLPYDTLPFEDGVFDLVISFYSLEHLFPLDQYVGEIIRILKPGGRLIGGIPCEGGLAWGMGRFLTSRRWLYRNTSINPDKIICWEHPNFADTILSRLDDCMTRIKLSSWPLGGPFLDLNLIAKFLYEK